MSRHHDDPSTLTPPSSTPILPPVEDADDAPDGTIVEERYLPGLGIVIRKERPREAAD